MKFIEIEQKSKKPILINVEMVRWVQASFVKVGLTVITFDNGDYLNVDADYEEVCKRIKDAEDNA